MPTNDVAPARNGFSLIALDAGLAAGLVIALLAVFGLDGFTAVPEPSRPASSVEEILPETRAVPRPLRLGVTPDHVGFDDMGSLLKGLGEGYKYRPFPLNDLLEAQKLDEFDIIFLACSGYPNNWLGKQTGNRFRGNGLYEKNPPVFAKAAETIRGFVGKGGTLYASDLHFNLISECFPEFMDRAAADAGSVQSLLADVVDPGLREILGPRIELRFDQPGWQPAAFAGEQAKTYLRGEFQSESGQRPTAPLLVKFPFQEGNVIFTSFHNEKQNSEIETKLLRYLVFTAVTANVDSQVSKTMLRGGFAPTKQNLFSTSAGAPSVSQSYNCKEIADLQFVLGFADQGARLRLTVIGPDGKTEERDGTSTITIGISNASKGVWKYTVTALSVPNENFPFTVTVGQK